MKIIEKSVAIVHFNLDIYYFEKYADVKPRHGNKFLWTSAENGTLIWTYMHAFALAADDSESDFLQCLQQMKMLCTIQDIKQDAEELIGIKKELALSMRSFLENNIWTFQDYLQYTLAPSEYYEAYRANDISGIQMALDIPYETKTMAQFEHEKQMMRSIPFLTDPILPSKQDPCL